MEIISFILLIISILLFFNLNPLSFFSSEYEKSQANLTLYDRYTSKKKKFDALKDFLNRNKYLYTLTGKKKLYIFFLLLSIIMFISGCVLSILFKNTFLIIPLAIIFAYIPLVIMDTYRGKMKNDLKKELISSLYQISSEYMQTYDLISSFSNNLIYIKNETLKTIFSRFIFELTSSNTGYKTCIHNLKNSLPFPFFKEYCNNLALCIDDTENTKTLLSHIFDERNEERSIKKVIAKIRSHKLEMYIMLSLIILNYPLIYILNPSWYTSLFSSPFGKIIVAVSVLFIFAACVIMRSKTNKLLKGDTEII